MSYGDRLLERREAQHLSLHLGLWPGEGDLAAAQARLDALVLDHAGLHEGAVVWDIGCGLGGTLLAASRRARLDLHGLNPSADQLDVARKAVPQATFHQGTAGAIPAEDGSVDVVLSVEAAFHFPSRAGFVAEARRVLKPGGRLVLTDLWPLNIPADARSELVEGIGPWPDVAGLTADWPTLFSEAAILDLSARTQPSYPCFLGPNGPKEWSPMTRAVARLQALQASGHVRVLLAAGTL